MVLSTVDSNTTDPYQCYTGEWVKPGVLPGKKYQWGFFEFKCYKKGTMHLRFLDKKVWETVNRAYAKIKGETLPEKL